MSGDDLVPLKRVLEDVGVSRATLWRALKSNLQGMPKPIKQRGRLFWSRSDLASLDAALRSFGGRIAYERERAIAHLRGAQRCATLLQRKRARRRRFPTQGRAAPRQEADLFDG